MSINIHLTMDEALVLHHWLSRTNKHEDNAFEDQAEQRVLWNVEALLEELLPAPFLEDYDVLVSEARNRVRDSDD